MSKYHHIQVREAPTPDARMGGRMKTPDINKLLRARPRSCQYGAPLGRSNVDDAPETERRYCQRIRFVDCDYSADGTYWGGSSPLYAVFSADLATLCFYRARTRADALAAHAESRP